MKIVKKKMGATMKKYKLIIFIMVSVVVFGLLGMSSSAFADDDDLSRGTLKGLNGILVGEIFIDEDAKHMGLDEKQTQSDVELKIRLAGIKVLTKEEFSKEKGFPMLLIQISTYKHLQDSLIYSISVQFCQGLYLMRNPNIKSFAGTWSVSRFGNGKIKDIRASLKDSLDIFINSYLSVNPKK